MMKTRDWKDTAELIGIAAIVASLIFVGLQMRQAEKIAGGERYESAIANRVEIRNAINEHADIWVRGNAGEDLDAVEAVVYANLMQNLGNMHSFSSRSAELVGNQRGADANKRDFAVYLHENPGARRLWETLQRGLEEARELLQPGQYSDPGFADFIRSNLDKLDKAKN